MDPAAAKQFAVDVVRKLRDAGHEALWAGGCVRDMLLGRLPQDYDVATSARPEQVRDIFGRKRTIEIGAAFGVITVIGRKPQGQIEVATFRCDAEYSDGRHPDSVSFSTAEEDALRRDFTINGLFYDPLAERIIDYVNGQADLAAKNIRAIRDPFARISEDKLRMLRAVRFAATFDFSLEPTTKAAIQQQASQIHVVSAERIAAEMRRMLVHGHRVRAVRLLRECNLLTEVLPEATAFNANQKAWNETLQILSHLQRPEFAVALAALIRSPTDADPHAIQTVAKRWKLSNEELHLATFVLTHEKAVREADRVSWPQLQRILIHDDIHHLIEYASAASEVFDDAPAALRLCKAKLALPCEELDPAPLLDGNDLRDLIQPSPVFKTVLTAVRNAQLEGELTSKQEALAYARKLISEQAEKATPS